VLRVVDEVETELVIDAVTQRLRYQSACHGSASINDSSAIIFPLNRPLCREPAPFRASAVALLCRRVPRSTTCDRVFACLVIGTVSAVSVQSAAPPQFNSRDTEQAVTVEGCLSGTHLRPELDAPNTNMVFKELRVKEFRVEGTKTLLKGMKVTSVKHVSNKYSVTSKGGLFTRDNPGPQ
jgi:hypothetical protein